MQKHYEIFKTNLSKIQFQFKLLLQNQPKLITYNKKALDAKKVALLIQKYIQQSPIYLYQIFTRNLGKTQLTWDDLLKCFQDQYQLSYTVLKRQSKQFSISQAKWNQINQFHKLLHYLKNKQKNYIYSIIKPNFNINISQQSSQCDILAILLEKQLVFYLVQQNRIICTFQFNYRNVKKKLLQKQQLKEIKKQQELRDKQFFDKMPLNDSNNYNNNILRNSIYNKGIRNTLQNSTTRIVNNNGTRKSSFSIKQKKTIKPKQDLSITSNSKKQHKSRLDSSVSSQFQGLKRNITQDIGVNDWKKKLISKNDSTIVKIRTNTTKKVFEYFTNANLQNSIEISKKFQQARDTFQKHFQLDKKCLEKQRNIQIEDIKVQKKQFNYSLQLQKMRLTSKNLYSSKQKNTNKNYYSTSVNLHDHLNKRNQLIMNNSLSNIQKNDKLFFNNSKKNDQSFLMNVVQQKKLLQDQKIDIVSFCLFQTYLLVALYNRQVRLFKIKKNLQRLKYQLIFQKENQYLVTYVQIYRSQFTNSYNMILCTHHSDNTNTIKIYQIKTQIITNNKINQFQTDKIYSNQLQGRQTQLSHLSSTKKNNLNIQSGFYKQIFCCKISFDPIYQNIIPLGLAAFNQKGMLAIIQTNSLGPSQNNKCQKKLFQKSFVNLVSGDLISFTCCKIHTNLIHIYLTCKNGYIYSIQRMSQTIKLQRKISPNKIVDISLIKNSSEILGVSEKGQLFIINSLTLQIMYYQQTYIDINGNSRLLNFSQNRFILYSNRDIRVIQITQNEQKYIQYQKPLKIYKNRLKIKKQQQRLSKQLNEISQKRNSFLENHFQKKQNTIIQIQNYPEYNINKSNNQTGISKNVQNKNTIKSKFKNRIFESKVIKQFYSINHTQTSHYILLLQTGQVLVYDYKAQYYGSYLIDKSMTIKQCQMNKKFYYLGILYTNNVIEVINIYNQSLLMRIQKEQNQQVQNIVNNTNTNQNKSLYLTNVNNKNTVNETLTISFMPEEVNNNQNEFFLSIDQSLTIYIYNIKGIKIKSINIIQYYQFNIRNNIIQENNQNSAIKKINCIYLDKKGIFISGTEKGQIFIHQKTTYACIKTLKLSYFSIIKIQPLSKFSNLKNNIQKNNFLLILTQNNQIFILNKQNQIFNKIYSSRKYLQQKKWINNQLSLQNKQGVYTNFKQKNIQKLSSIHYFNKTVFFNQKMIIYQWEQVYTVNDNTQIKRDNGKQYEIQNIQKTSKNKLQTPQRETNTNFLTFKRVGYLIEKIQDFNKKIDKNMSFTEKKSQFQNTQQKQYFLEICHYSYLKSKNKFIQTQKQINCFAEGYKLTIIISQPKNYNKGIHKNKFVQQINNLELIKQEKNQRKSVIKIYDFSQFLNQNLQNHIQCHPSIILEQVI